MQLAPQTQMLACRYPLKATRVEEDGTYVRRSGEVVDSKFRLNRIATGTGSEALWSATNLALGTGVTLQFLPPIDDATPPVSPCTIPEALLRIRHPNLVHVYDLRTTEAGSYLVMEPLIGADFESLLQLNGPLSPIEACRAILPLLEGVQAIHDEGFVHGDVKPPNVFFVLMNGRAYPKLLWPRPWNGKRGTAAELPLPAPGEAPALRAPLCHTDVREVCALLYECLTGNPPSVDDTAQDVVQSDGIRTSAELRVGVREDFALERIIARGLQTMPERSGEASEASARDLGRRIACWLLDRGVSVDISRQSLRAVWLGSARKQTRAWRQTSLGQMEPPSSREAPPPSETLRRSVVDAWHSRR